MLQAINLQLVGLPLLCVDVSKMTAISLADSSFTSEIGAGAILIGLRRVGCEVIAVHRYTHAHQNSTFTMELLGVGEFIFGILSDG